MVRRWTQADWPSGSQILHSRVSSTTCTGKTPRLDPDRGVIVARPRARSRWPNFSETHRGTGKPEGVGLDGSRASARAAQHQGRAAQARHQARRLCARRRLLQAPGSQSFTPEPLRMAGPKLKVVLTRKLPSDIETRMRELFDCADGGLNGDDHAFTVGELRSALERADVLVPTITDRIDAALLAHAGPNLKMIANFGAGMDHIDVAAADCRGHGGHQHAGRPHRRHRRHRHGPDPGGGAADRGGGRSGPAR